MHPDIGAVLFDSGDTLVRPDGGTWWPRREFLALARELDLAAGEAEIRAAHEAAMSYLDENHHLHTLEEELQQFRIFYGLVFEHLGARVTRGAVERLAYSYVHEAGFEPFPDALEVVHSLRGAGLSVGLVSDAWPSLEKKFRDLGIRALFEPFVVSAHLGSCKPHPANFRAALEPLGLPPERVLFVDDSPANVRGATDLGLQAVLLDRPGTASPEYRRVRTLSDVLPLVGVDPRVS